MIITIMMGVTNFGVMVYSDYLCDKGLFPCEVVHPRRYCKRERSANAVSCNLTAFEVTTSCLFHTSGNGLEQANKRRGQCRDCELTKKQPDGFNRRACTENSYHHASTLHLQLPIAHTVGAIDEDISSPLKTTSINAHDTDDSKR